MQDDCHDAIRRRRQIYFDARGFHPTVMCRFFGDSSCTRGESCTYAHWPEERTSVEEVANKQRFADRLKPSKLCKHWLHEPTSCKQGATCKFAHGLAEIGLKNTDCVSILVGLKADATVEVLYEIGGDSCGRTDAEQAGANTAGGEMLGTIVR